MAFFSGKLAFITGGSSGIGLETARLLAARGCNLVLLARNSEKLETACRDIEPESVAGAFVAHVSLDVADNEDVRQKIPAAVAQYGTPDIFINSAGIGTAGYFENLSWQQFDRIIKVNVYGPRNTISAVLPFMKKNRKGHIVNLSSAAGLLGMFGYSYYSTSKFALVGLSECLRSELKLVGIGVTVVCPPEVKTPFLKKEAPTLPPEGRAVKSMAGLLKPEYVAKTIVRAIKKNKFLVVPGPAARFLYFSHRISNGLFIRLPADFIIRRIAGKRRN